jgi:hypothetical protein
MSDIDTDAIRARAEAAMRPEWHCNVGPGYPQCTEATPHIPEASYGCKSRTRSVALDPQTVLALLAEVERLRAVQREDYAGIDNLVAERDRLRAQVQAVRALPYQRAYEDVYAALDGSDS